MLVNDFAAGFASGPLKFVSSDVDVAAFGQSLFQRPSLIVINAEFGRSCGDRTNQPVSEDRQTVCT